MKKNMIIIIGAITLVLMLSISGVYIVENLSDLEKDYSNPKIPKILGCFDTIYGLGEEIQEGYVTLRYDYLVKNEKNNPAVFEIDWGDGTTSITPKTDDRRYVPHAYSESGTYKVKVRYNNEEYWSEPYKITMIDFFDLSVGEITTEPSGFKPRQNIKLSVEITNIGTIPSEKNAKVIFYYLDGNEEEFIEETKVDILKSGESQKVEISFKWFNDREKHTILVELQELDGERTKNNNIDLEGFSATKILSLNIQLRTPLITKIFNQFPNIFPILRELLKL